MDSYEAFNSASAKTEEREESLFSGLHLDSDTQNNYFAPFQPSPVQMIKETLLYITEMLPEMKEMNQRTMIDLGSGDGRWPIVAAQKFGFQSVGIDIDEALVEQARQTAIQCSVQDKAQFIEGDFGSLKEVTTRKYSVCVCYLLPDSVVLPLVSELLWHHYKSGSVIVSPHFDLAQLRAADGDKQEGLQLWHKTASGAFLYRNPDTRTRLKH